MFGHALMAYQSLFITKNQLLLFTLIEYIGFLDIMTEVVILIGIYYVIMQEHIFITFLDTHAQLKQNTMIATLMYTFQAQFSYGTKIFI
jgi:hypothetical protein